MRAPAFASSSWFVPVTVRRARFWLVLLLAFLAGWVLAGSGRSDAWTEGAGSSTPPGNTASSIVLVRL